MISQYGIPTTEIVIHYIIYINRESQTLFNENENREGEQH